MITYVILYCRAQICGSKDHFTKHCVPTEEGKAARTETYGIWPLGLGS